MPRLKVRLKIKLTQICKLYGTSTLSVVYEFEAYIFIFIMLSYSKYTQKRKSAQKENKKINY